MKKFYLFLIILFLISCEEDIPNQLTSVEGIVTDYYSMKPVSGISLEVYEHESFVLNGDVLMTDKLISNAMGIITMSFITKITEVMKLKPYQQKSIIRLLRKQ